MNKLLTTLSATLLLLAPATASAKSHKTTTTPGTATTTATTAQASATQTATTPAAPTRNVNVNTASAADLTTVPGITASIAADVIKNRPYKNKDELVKKVKGIGPKNVLKMLPYLSF